MTYNLLEPHVAALLRWLGTLSSNIEVHLQLPPALAALRGILNSILDQTVSTATWASMIEVGDALEQLLTHDADTLGLAARGEHVCGNTWSHGVRCGPPSRRCTASCAKS